MLDHFAVLKGIAAARRAQGRGRRAAQADQPLGGRASASSAPSPAACGSASASPRRCSATRKLIIVDEPTAGLDPEERHRFHNLLGEIGENVVVILSTHIVEDVTDLCTADGDHRRRPGAAHRRAARRRSPTLDGQGLAARCRQGASSPSTSGASACSPRASPPARPVIHVLSRERTRTPASSRSTPDLEDVYFQRLRQHAQAA